MLDMLLTAEVIFAQGRGGSGGSDTGGAAFGTGFMICQLVGLVAFWLLTGLGKWKAFEKAGEPGWAGLIPIYEFIVQCKIADKPLWWVALFFIPCVGGIIGLVLVFIVSIEIANRFGRSGGFGVGLALLAPIFWPILGFGSSEYGRRRKKKRYIEDDYDEPAPRPRRRREGDEGYRRTREEYEEDRPRKVRRRDDEEEPPRKVRRRDDDEDRPRKPRPRDDDDDDDPPRRVRRRDDR
jgi:hypothetical protein